MDAAHRAEHQAPADDAYTWSFALDRLLLGHASGADADIAGVAAWPDLEGSMLTALDTLIRLLRVLANTRQRLSEALLPTQWRERLLSLLDALLPDIPTAPSGIQRPLERLRRLDRHLRHRCHTRRSGLTRASRSRAYALCRFTS